MTDDEPHDPLAVAASLAAEFARDVDTLPVTPRVTAREIREHLAAYDFAAPADGAAVIADIASMLRRWNVHVTHPRYFGLFNPSVVPAAVAAEALAAAVNPQLAVWSHAPAANEIERHALRALARLAGYDPDASAAHFTTGGQESNLTAV